MTRAKTSRSGAWLLAMVAGLMAVATSTEAGQTPAACPPDGQVEFVCGLEAPEDLVAVPDSTWLVAGAYAGSGGIYLIDTGDRSVTKAYPADSARDRLDRATYGTCPGVPTAEAKARFVTHGLSLQPGTAGRHRLYAVHHGSRESIEVFELDATDGTPTLTWIGCAVAPDPIGLNSVRALADGGFIASNFLPRTGGRGATQLMMKGETNGELWEWHPGAGWERVPGSEAAGANGLEMSEDGRVLYVAAWGSQSFFRLSHGRTPVARQEIPLGFRVDNIRWGPDGSLLATGQVLDEGSQATVVAAVDPITLDVVELVRYPDVEDFGAGTVAVRVGDELWVGSFRGDRVAVFPAP